MQCFFPELVGGNYFIPGMDLVKHVRFTKDKGKKKKKIKEEILEGLKKSLLVFQSACLSFCIIFKYLLSKTITT